MMKSKLIFNTFPFQSFWTVFLVILFGCSAKKNEKERRLYRFEPAILTSEGFLTCWNEATISAIEKEAFKFHDYKNFLIEEYRNDSTNSRATSRKGFLRILKYNWSFPDSVNFKAIYILEMEFDGEYKSIKSYFILDTEEDDYFYELRSIRGSWEIKKVKRVIFLQ